MTFLGIDLGTSSIKGAVLDLALPAVREVRHLPFPVPINGPPPLFHEVDPTEILATTQKLIAELLPMAPDCEGIVMCGQMGGLILTNGQGKALSNYISWQDKRMTLAHPTGTGCYFDVFLQRFDASDWEQLGKEVRPGLPPSLLFWLMETGQMPPEGTIAAHLPDFVAAHLCGCSPVTHASSAVGSLNVKTGDWHHALFSRLGLGSIRWPLLQDFRVPVGHLNSGPRSLPIYTPVGDHQCSLAGAGLRLDELSVNVSTGSQVSLLALTPEVGNYQVRAFFDGRFLKTVTNLPAGRSLNVLIRFLRELKPRSDPTDSEVWAYIATEAEKVHGTDLQVDLAFFPSPVGDRGAIGNIGEHNLTVGQVFRAAFENMGKNYHQAALRLSPDKAWTAVLFSGGLVQKVDVLRRTIIEKIKGTWRMCTGTEDALQGLLTLALVITGRACSVEAATALLSQQEGIRKP